MSTSPDEFDLAPLVRGAFTAVVESFAPNELAYLALTSKIEAPIRDRLAFALHSRLAGDGFLVAREWKRVDIAILHGSDPVAFVELKAMYTFDGFKPEYEIALLKDFEKCRRLGADGAQIFTLLLATHPHGQPKSTARGVVKYAEHIRQSLAKHGDHEAVAHATVKKIAGWQGAQVLDSGHLNGGEAFGVTVSVLYWLFRLPAKTSEVPAEKPHPGGSDTD